MPLVPTRIVESALYVTDLARSVDFYERVLGLERMLDDERFAAFEICGGQVLLLFVQGTAIEEIEISPEIGVIPPHDAIGRQHLGFGVAREAIPAWEDHLDGCGVEVEARNDWPKGGQSLYFRDPDGHLLELLCPGVWPNY